MKKKSEIFANTIILQFYNWHTRWYGNYKFGSSIGKRYDSAGCYSSGETE